MTDDIAETDAIVAELDRACLVTVSERVDGQTVCTLAHKGEQVSRQIALRDEDDILPLLDALVEDIWGWARLHAHPGHVVPRPAVVAVALAAGVEV